MSDSGSGPSRRGAGATWLRPRTTDAGLRQYVGIVRRSWWLVAACLAVCVGAAVAYVVLAPPTYKAQASLLVTPVDGSDENLIGLGLIPGSSDPTRDVSTAAAFVTDPAVARRVAAAAGGDPDQLRDDIDAVPLAESNLVTITARARSARRAKELANAFAQETVAERTQRLQERLDRILPGLRKQVDRAGNDASTAGLRSRLTTLESMTGQSDPTIHVELPAVEPAAPTSPRPKLSIAAGIIAGLVIGLGAAFALEAFDPRIRREDTLREMFDLPVLARIQHQRGSSGPLPPWETTPGVREDFRMLGVSLGIQAAHGDRRSVLLTGAGPSEGKSTVALNLAAALAHEGNEVILLEADLHRPSLGEALKLHRRQGVVRVLLGDLSVEEALTTFVGLPGRLRGLLVEQRHSHVTDTPIISRFAGILDRSKELADFVVVDAPPIPEVTDALLLAEQVDDVLLVVRLGRTRHDRLMNLGESLAHQGIRPSGIVVVGVEGHRDGSYYASAPRRSRRHARRAPADLDGS